MWIKSKTQQNFILSGWSDVWSGICATHLHILINFPIFSFLLPVQSCFRLLHSAAWWLQGRRGMWLCTGCLLRLSYWFLRLHFIWSNRQNWYYFYHLRMQSLVCSISKSKSCQENGFICCFCLRLLRNFADGKRINGIQNRHRCFQSLYYSYLRSERWCMCSI